MEAIARTPGQFANAFRERRRKLGLTQEQLAERVGVRQKTVSEIENSGTARLSTVLRALSELDLELVVRPRTRRSVREIAEIF